MGCDIHMVVEVKTEKEWEEALSFLDCNDCDATGVNKYVKDSKPGSCYWCQGSGRISSYRDRNYDAFAILANVRNGEGSGGCDTGDSFPSIAPNRGLPDDFHTDDEEKYHYDTWMGDHSFTWLTLKELLDYDWTRSRVCRGIVTAKEYRKAKVTGKPDSYCGGVWGLGTETVSNEKMAALITAAVLLGDTELNQLTKYYTQLDWNETFAECAGNFHSRFIPGLVKLAEDNNVPPENVRLVMGFDN